MADMKDMVQKILADSMLETSMLAEAINDYNRTLELRWIPKNQRTDAMEEKLPYVIVQNLPNGGTVPIMYLSEGEAANPPGVIARLYNSDHSKGQKGDVLKRIENSENARRLWELRKEEERLAEKLDVAKFFWKTKKHTVVHNGRKIDTETLRGI